MADDDGRCGVAVAVVLAKGMLARNEDTTRSIGTVRVINNHEAVVTLPLHSQS